MHKPSQRRSCQQKVDQVYSWWTVGKRKRTSAGGDPDVRTPVNPKVQYETGTDVPQGLIGDTITPRCLVDGIDTHCLLDSGSQVTLISKSFFDCLNRDLHPLNDLVLFHGGDGKMPYLGWTYVSMGFDDSFSGTGSQFNTFALVVPGGRNSSTQPGEQKSVCGFLRNVLRKRVTVLVEAQEKRRLPTGLEVTPLVTQLLGNSTCTVKVVVTNHTNQKITVPGNCPLADAFVP